MMREIIELRVNHEFGHLLFAPQEARKSGRDLCEFEWVPAAPFTLKFSNPEAVPLFPEIFFAEKMQAPPCPPSGCAYTTPDQSVSDPPTSRKSPK
jgi:hypothetical protein